MARALALAASLARPAPEQLARAAIVSAFALTLILAGQALPF